MKYTKPGIGFIALLILLLSVAIVDKATNKEQVVEQIKIESKVEIPNTLLASNN